MIVRCGSSHVTAAPRGTWLGVPAGGTDELEARSRTHRFDSRRQHVTAEISTMLKKEVARGDAGHVVIMDSITKVTADDEGAVVVSGSHGGASSGEFALEIPLEAVFFNDAGVGKDDAGIVSLAMLQKRGVACGTVSHTSARIGDAQDMWDHGVISHVNETARKLGLTPGTSLRQALSRLVKG
jgi:uncharacterized protein YunC (DUF1805 family)